MTEVSSRRIRGLTTAVLEAGAEVAVAEAGEGWVLGDITAAPCWLSGTSQSSSTVSLVSTLTSVSSGSWLMFRYILRETRALLSLHSPGPARLRPLSTAPRPS